jgi:calcineurin-like phosphoesterase family protein
MSKVFAIADLHLGHKKVALARGFSDIDEYNWAMITYWNIAVSKRDSVFVLGDVVFGQHNLPLLAELNGTKKLIMGNHDKYPIAKYLPYFSQIFGCVKYKECILSHIPVHENQFERFKYNIHGHLHTKVVTTSKMVYPSGFNIGGELQDVPDKRYICVSAEQTNLTPVLFSSLIGE